MSVSYVYKISRLDAFSTETGIVISSRAFSDISKMCISVNYDENDKIQSTIHNKSIRVLERDYMKEQKNRIKEVSAYNGFACVLITALYFIANATIHSKTFTTIATFSLISLCLSNALVSIGNYIGNFVYLMKHPALSRFHSAEHMAILAFRKLERMPSVEEIKKISRFDPSCSQVDIILIPLVTGLVDSIILTIAISIVHFGLVKSLDELYGTNWFFCILPVFVIYYGANERLITFLNGLIKKLFEHEAVVKFFQWPLLIYPTEREFTLVHEALRQREMMDKDIKEHAEDYTTQSVFFNTKDSETVYILDNDKELYTTIDEYIAWIETYKNAEIIESDDKEEEKNT